MLVADYIIKRLQEYTDYVFQVYGSASASLIDAFTRLEKPEMICCQHEQHATFMSEGYTKVTNKIGVVITTSGPGAMNALTGLGNAFYDSFPMLLITGQVNSRFMRPHDGIRQVGFQETDIVSMAKPITKYAKLLLKAEDVRYELEKAIHLAMDGRPGPVLLDIPLDVQKQEIDPDKLVGFIDNCHQIQNIGLVSNAAKDFIKDLRNSKRPCILIGGGVKREHLILLNDVLNSLKIPVYPTYNALDIICSDNPYYGGRIGTFGGAGRNFGIQNCDLLLAIGTRISGRITGGDLESFARGAKKYLVNIDETSLDIKYQEVKFDVNVKGDVASFLYYLNGVARYIKNHEDNHTPIPDFSEWTNKCIEWRDKYDPVKPEHFKDNDKAINQYGFLRTLSNLMTKDDILCVDCGGNLVATNHAFKTKEGQIYITNNGNSPMGGSLCYAIGAYFGQKVLGRKGNVVCIIGDGGMMVNLSALQTIVDYDVNIKVFVLNNQIYGITKAFQKSNFDGRHIACGGQESNDYRPCDFNCIASAIGIVNSEILPNDVVPVLNKIHSILNLRGGTLVNVDCKDFATYSPALRGWGVPIEEQTPYLPRKEFFEQMIIEPTEFSKNLNV